MEIKDLLKTVDHTVLLPTASWEDVKEALDDGMKYSVAACCIAPYYIKRAGEYVCGSLIFVPL